MEQLIIGVFEQGFIYAIMALGVYITYKILDFPDLSVDSTFPLGAAVTTVMLSSGKNPLLALVAATLAGAFAGMITGIIHVKFKVRDLLSGIIVMTGLYTLNLRIVGGSANVPLFNYKSVFDNDFINGIFPEALAPYIAATGNIFSPPAVTTLSENSVIFVADKSNVTSSLNDL